MPGSEPSDSERVVPLSLIAKVHVVRTLVGRDRDLRDGLSVGDLQLHRHRGPALERDLAEVSLAVDQFDALQSLRRERRCVDQKRVRTRMKSGEAKVRGRSVE